MLWNVFQAIFWHPMRGIPCNHARAYISVENFKIFVANNENVGDNIMKAIANRYGLNLYSICLV